MKVRYCLFMVACLMCWAGVGIRSPRDLTHEKILAAHDRLQRGMFFAAAYSISSSSARVKFIAGLRQIGLGRTSMAYSALDELFIASHAVECRFRW